MATNARIQFRRDTAANWTSADPTLLSGEIGIETDTDKLKIGDGSTAWTSLGYFAPTTGLPAEIVVAVSDETTALTTGTAKTTFRMPFAMNVDEVRASVSTAPTDAALIVDINETAASILSTEISIDSGQKTSTTSGTPPVISDASLADDAEITIDIDQVGSTIAGAGLKVYIIGTRA